MPVPSLDIEFQQYWIKLTAVQKQSLLSVVKSFIQVNERISVEQYNQEIDEALNQAATGNYISQEEMEKVAEKW